jgi:hypothetical protein
MNEVITINFEDALTMSSQEIRDTFKALAVAMKNSPNVVKEELTHRNSYGVYAREMKIKKGTLLLGRVHKYETMNFLLEGEVYVLSPTEGLNHYVAPCTVVAKPLSQRLFYALQDTTWTVCIGTHEKDPDKIEDEFTMEEYNEVES